MTKVVGSFYVFSLSAGASNAAGQRTHIYVVTWKPRDAERQGTSIYIVNVEVSRRWHARYARLCSCRTNLKSLCVCNTFVVVSVFSMQTRTMCMYDVY